MKMVQNEKIPQEVSIKSRKLLLGQRNGSKEFIAMCKIEQK